MNKISKKITAMVTTAAFALTLVPVAAFAGNMDPAESSFTVDSSASAKEQLVVSVDLNAVADATADRSNTALKVVVTNEDGTALQTINGSDNVNISGFGSGIDGGSYTVADIANKGFNVDNADPITLTYSNVPAGNYEVAVSVDVDTADNTEGFVPLSVPAGESASVYVYGDATAGASYLTTDKGTAITVDPDTTKEINFVVTDGEQTGTDEQLTDVYIWAENEDGYLTDAVAFSANGKAYSNNDRIFSAGTVDGDTAITAHFNYPGNYTIYAAKATGVTASATTAETALTNIDPFHAGVKVTINARNYVTKTIELNPNADGTMVAGTKANTYTYTITDGVTPNGIKVYEVEGVALQANGTPAQYETLNISCVKSDLKVLDTEVGTNAKGEFSFRFTIAEPGSYTVKIAEANGDATATLTVVDETAAPLDIKTTEQGGTLLAGNDSNYAANRYQYLTDAVQFSIIDVYDDEAEGANVIANEGAADKDSTDPEHSDLLAVTAKGDKSTLDEDDLELAWDEAHGVYTLEYVGTTPSTDLVPGKYTVEVSLNNGKKAVASFNLAKFGTVQDVILDMTADHYAFAGQTSQDNAITAIDDQVALGQRVTIDPKYVDENGIKINADLADIQLGVNGEAVADRDLNNGIFYTEPNVAANNSLIGTVITVKAFDEVNSKYVEKELTVVKAYLAETLSFDPTSGAVNADNDVTVSVVDEDGNISKVNGTLSAYVADKSNADANVELDVDQNVRNGKGELTLYSDAEGTVDVVAVVTADNGEMYGATLTYTFGAEDPEAENTVVMTIGSTDYVVNNDIIKGDAAPYVDAQWRTMVPFRVLGETFGAEVNWDQDTQTVTYTYGDTELTMTIGEETYTVNGTEKTMDTAPVLSGDRTFVPVRFVGEALGYTVTALQDTETGLTASVVFQK